MFSKSRRRRSGVLGLAVCLLFASALSFASALAFFELGVSDVSDRVDFFLLLVFLPSRWERKGRIEEAPPALPLAMDLAGALGLFSLLLLATLPLFFWLDFREFKQEVFRLAQLVHLQYFFLQGHRLVEHLAVVAQLQHLALVSAVVFDAVGGSFFRFGSEAVSSVLPLPLFFAAAAVDEMDAMEPFGAKSKRLELFFWIRLFFCFRASLSCTALRNFNWVLLVRACLVFGSGSSSCFSGFRDPCSRLF